MMKAIKAFWSPKYYIFACFCVVILVLAVFPALSGALTLDEAVRIEWQQTPVLKAQEKLYQISLSDIWRKYLPGEPQVQLNSGDNGSSFSYGASITLPLKAALMNDLSSLQAGQQRAELDAKKFELAGLAASAYLDCAVQAALIKQQKITIADLDTLDQSLKKRFKDGFTGLSDSLGSELQLRDAKIELEDMNDKFFIAKENLRRLLELTNQLPDDFTLDDDIAPGLLDEIGSDTADHERAQADVLLAQANFKTALWQQLPDLSLSGSWNSYPYLPASPSGKPNSWSFSAGIAIPLLYPLLESVEAERTKNQAVLDQAAAKSRMIQAELDKTDAALEYSRSRKLLKELREKEIPMAEMLVSATFSDYINGKVGFAELMQSRKTLMDIQSREIQLRASTILCHLRAIGEEKEYEN